MFLYDEKRIINTALVERFGFAPNHESFLTADYDRLSFVDGRVIAEFKKGASRTWEVLYEGNTESCQEFYVNLAKALAQENNRMVYLKDLWPVESD